MYELTILVDPSTAKYPMRDIQEKTFKLIIDIKVFLSVIVVDPVTDKLMAIKLQT